MRKLIQTVAVRKSSLFSFVRIAVALLLLLCGCGGGGDDITSDSENFPPITSSEKSRADAEYESSSYRYFDGTSMLYSAEAPYSFVRRFEIEKSCSYRFALGIYMLNQGYEGGSVALYDENMNLIAGVKNDPNSTYMLSTHGAEIILEEDSPYFECELYSGEAFYLKAAAVGSYATNIGLYIEPTLIEYLDDEITQTDLSGEWKITISDSNVYDDDQLSNYYTLVNLYANGTLTYTEYLYDSYHDSGSGTWYYNESTGYFFAEGDGDLCGGTISSDATTDAFSVSGTFYDDNSVIYNWVRE